MVDRLPVHFRHLLVPEVVPLQPPRLPEHLLPFALGVYGDFRPAQADPASFAGAAALAGGLLPGGDDAQAAVRPIDQLLAVAGEGKGLDAIHKGIRPKLFEIPGPQQTVAAATALLVVFIFLAAFDGQNGEECLARCAGDSPIAAFGYGEGQHPVGDAVQIDTNELSLFGLALFLFVLFTVFPITGRFLALLTPLGGGFFSGQIVPVITGPAPGVGSVKAGERAAFVVSVVQIVVQVVWVAWVVVRVFTFQIVIQR